MNSFESDPSYSDRSMATSSMDATQPQVKLSFHPAIAISDYCYGKYQQSPITIIITGLTVAGFGHSL